MSKQGFVYILASGYNGTLYIGATTNLLKRVHEHKSGTVKGFSQKYATSALVYYEIFDDFKEAFAKEKQMKAWNRSWKIKLIKKDNPRWEDLYHSVVMS